MPTVMIDLHGSLGSLVMSAALILAVLAFGAFLLGTRRPGRVPARVVDLAVVAAVVLIAVTMFAGGLIFIGGERPQQILHLAYGASALLVLPAAAVLGVRAENGGSRSGSRYLWIAGGAFALFGLALRLAQTGGG